jgi:SulP family sulfate permease
MGSGHINYIVLRVKRTRNPDLVALEHFDRFLHEMAAEGRTVLLCGVRPDLAKAMQNLKFNEWFPAEHLYLEEDEKFSATLKAVRRVHELLDEHDCLHCQQNGTAAADREPQYYLV